MSHEQRISPDPDDSLDQYRRDLVGGDANFLILRRRDEDGDIATLRTRVARQRLVRERDVWAESDFVDEEPVSDEECRFHATARNAVRFGEELARAEEDRQSGQDAQDERASARHE